MSLGVNAFGEHAGYLMIREESSSMEMYTPSHLKLYSNLAGEVIRSGGNVRQIRTAQGLVDVITNSSGYVVNFHSGVGSVVGGLYTPAGSTNAIWSIENPDAPSGNSRMRIVEIRGGESRTHLFEWSSTYGGWILTRPDGLGKEIRGTTGVLGGVQENYVITTTNDTVVFEETKIWRFDDHLASHTIGSGAGALTTTYLYYTNIADTHNFGELSQIVRPSGGWETYEYTNGRLSKVVTGFQDSSLASADNLNRVNFYSYASVDTNIDSGTISTNTPRLEIESLQGNEVRRKYRVITNGLIIEALCLIPGNSVWHSANLFTTNLITFTNTFDGTIENITYPEGTMEIRQTGRIVDGSWSTNIVWRGQPNGNRTAVTNGMKVVELVNATGQLISRTTTDVASGIVTANETYGYSGAYSLATSVTTLDGRTVSMNYDCCELNSTTDKEGVTTYFTYDGLDRVLTTTRNGITHSNVLDPAGNVLARVRIGTDGSKIPLESSGYATSGRISASIDAMTNQTLFGYVDDTIRSNYHANGSVRFEQYFKDGVLKKVTGSATHPVRYTSGSDTPGQTFSTEIKLNADGTDSDEWIKTITDMAGRHFQTLYSDSAVATSFYNTKGQLARQLDPDNVTNVFGYNGKGELEFQGIDLNYSGSPETNSADRLARTVVDYVNNGSANVRRTRTFLYTTNGEGNFVALTNEVSIDGRQSWSKQYGLTNSTRTEYGFDTRKVTQTRTDGSSSISFYNAGYLRWTANYDSNDIELGRTVFDYDAHGRQRLVTDARNGTTTNVFNNADQIQSVTTPAPTPTGNSQVTTVQYNNMGQVWRVVFPDSESMTNLYWPNGELKLTSGARTYPAGYTYDAQGRMTHMTNWSDFGGGSGARVTTWSYHPYRGWLTAKTYPTNGSVLYTNTAGGRLRSRTWARGIITFYGYNPAGDLTSIDYSDSTPDITLSHDRRGRRVGVIRDGVTTAYVLNNAGQTMFESYLNGPLAGLGVTNEYDNLLRRTHLRGPSMDVGYSYDAASRLDTVTHGADSATYTYLAHSPLVQDLLFKHSGEDRMITSRQYDRLNRLTQIGSMSSAAGPYTYRYDYNSANQRTKRTEADGSNWNYLYDTLGQVTIGKKKWSDTTYVAGQQFEYAFDTIGNRTQTKTGGNASGTDLRTANYSANSLNQITSRDVPDAVDVFGSAPGDAIMQVNGDTNVTRKGEYWRFAFTNDNSALAVYASVTNQAILGSATNTLDPGHVFLPEDDEIFSYDADGNQTNDGRWALTWDGENRLRSMTSHSTAPEASKRKLEFTYDWMGRRIQKIVSTWNGSGWTSTSTRKFLYDDWNLIAELNGTNNAVLRNYVWGADLSGTMDGAGGVGGLLMVSSNHNVLVTPIIGDPYWESYPMNHCVAYDGNGNVMVLIDANTGMETGRYEYGPFGEAIRVTGVFGESNPVRFSSKYMDDESAWMNYGFRVLGNGRWINRDPIEEEGGLNLYGMIDNDSINFVDPYGLAMSRPLYPPQPPRTLPLNRPIPENERGCCDEATIKKGEVELKSRYKKASDDAKRLGLKPHRPPPLGSGPATCKNTSQDVLEYLLPTPACWQCYTEERNYYSPAEDPTDDRLDHQVVICVGYTASGSIKEIIFDWWGDKKGGENQSGGPPDKFRQKYRYPRKINENSYWTRCSDGRVNKTPPPCQFWQCSRPPIYK